MNIKNILLLAKAINKVCKSFLRKLLAIFFPSIYMKLDPVFRMKLHVKKYLKNLRVNYQLIESYKQNRYSQTSKSPRIAVFTAIAGDYDSIKLPLVINSNFDYFLFTDNPPIYSGVWEVRDFPFVFNDPTRTCRYVKTHPHVVLSGYDYAIWIDANIMIVGDIYKDFDNFVKSRLPIAAVPHPLRNNIYQEVEACKRLNKDDYEIMRNQVEYYACLDFEHDDLIESNWMMFSLKDVGVGLFLEIWWSEIERFSRRDQLSLNYAINKVGLSWFSLTEKRNSVRNHHSLILVPHDFDKGPAYDLLYEVARYHDTFKKRLL